VTARLAPNTAKKIFEIIPADHVKDFTIGERSLEDIFSEIYRRTSESRT
jgi:hypothetical protein